MAHVTHHRAVCWLIAAAAMLVVSAMAGPAGASYRLVVLSDRTGGHQEGVYPSIIREIDLLGPDIVVTVGDQIEGYGDDMELASAEWDTLLAMLDTLEAPVYLTAGNHDIWSDDSEELYRRRTGFEPYYSFDHGGTHYIILDTSRIEAWDQIEEEQLAWLATDLEGVDPDDQIFVFYHKPLWIMTTAAGVSDPVHGLFVERGVDAVFTGHFHNYFSGEYDGIAYTSLGSSGGYIYHPDTQPVARGQFYQFAWLTVGEDGFDMAVIDAGNIYPRDFLTVDDMNEVQAIESDYVRTSPLRVAEDAVDAGEIVVTVENRAPVAIDDEITWSEVEGWDILPAAVPVSLEPGETAEFPFAVTPPEKVFPAPSLGLTYPLTNGMEVAAEVPLRVVRTARAARFSAAPAIDGAVTEPCWSGAAAVTRLYPAYDDYEIDGETAFRFGVDDEHLYVSVVCMEPQVGEIVSVNEEHDSAVYRDDCVGFFFQPDTDEMVVYQIYFNPSGAAFDQRITFDEAMIYTTDLTWDGEYDAVARVGEDRWTLEAAIPLSEFGVTAGAGDVWRVNFRRKQQRAEAVEDWQVPIDYNPNTFGELVLQ